MKNLKKPEVLRRGDKIALVSLSSGIAGDESLFWRYKLAKRRLDVDFSLKGVEMNNTLKGSEYIYLNPEQRAMDLMDAFLDPSIKGIFSCIGGNDSIRLLPYIDFDIIAKNPKVLMGYSDTTIAHLICLRAGIVSIYGPSLMVDFAENGSMHDYTVSHLKKALFSSESLGEVKSASEWTSEYIPWEESNASIKRTYKSNSNFELIQGKGIATGWMLGGCIETFDSTRGTVLFPTMEEFNDAVLFFETSDDKPTPSVIEGILRTYGIMGIYDKIKGMVWGKPYNEVYYNEYKEVIIKVMKEFGKENMPILYNLNFGHTEPKFCIPYGALARINAEKNIFSILDSGVR